jgi:membrane associated rhomboid family serine protease
MSSRINQLPWGWIWAASIIGVWLVVAVALGQPVWTQQHSRDLVAFGTFRGDTLTWAESWRLIASQWLHVKFPHMLLNALLIGLIGQALAQRFGGAIMLGAGVALGAVGQVAGALLMPDAYISGASQAYLGLAAIGLLTLPLRSVGWGASAVGVAVALALDLFVSGHGAAKVGHVLPFVLGLGTGLLLRRAAKQETA